jgi:methylmalonyl-CoA/ethylmalonyl-CoA epimerase
MIKKIEHIGIAVEDLVKSEELFEKLLGQKPYKKEDVQSEAVRTSFFKVADQKLELLHATSDESPIKKFIDKRDEGVHHIALHVDSIKKEVSRLELLGFEFISTTPKKGADNKMIVFIHPKTTNGVLVELCEDI